MRTCHGCGVAHGGSPCSGCGGCIFHNGGVCPVRVGSVHLNLDVFERRVATEQRLAMVVGLVMGVALVQWILHVVNP